MDMNIKELLLGAGSMALNTFVPGAGSMVHKLIKTYVLDEDIPDQENLTGDEAAKIISTKLDGNQQVMILERKVDLAIQQSLERMNESNNSVKMREMDNAEILKGVSPRPEAVKRMVHLLSVQVYAMMALMFAMLIVNGIVYYKGGESILKISDVIPDFAIMGTIMGTPALVIMKYFGDRSKDKHVFGTVMAGGDPSKTVSLAQAIKSRISR